MLDTALSQLNEIDRNAVLLRYFERRSLKEVGIALGLNEDAAQKRVARSLEKLRKFLLKRGPAMSAAGLGTLLSEFAVQSAPAGVASAVLSAAASCAPGVTPSVLILETLSLMTAKQTVALFAGLMVVLTAPSVMLWQTTRKLEKENQALRALNQQLKSARPSAGAAPKADPGGTAQRERDVAELARLRAEVAALRGDARRHGKTCPRPTAELQARWRIPCRA